MRRIPPFWRGMAIIAAVSVAILAGHAGGAAARPSHFVFAAFMAQFSVAAAYNITYAPYVSDYSRYMPRNTSPRGIITAVFFGASGSATARSTSRWTSTCWIPRTRPAPEPRRRADFRAGSCWPRCVHSPG